jgi:ATP-dependent protease ClpP protease subunit
MNKEIITQEDDDEDFEGSSQDVVKIYEEKISRNKLSIYLDDSFDSCTADYRELFQKFSNAKADDEILLHLASYGGDCHVGFQICHAIKNCKANIIIKVDQPCYSMGAVMACCGKKLIMNPATFLMFHNYSGGNRGKGGELCMSIREQDNWLHRSFKHFCSPFLNDAELERLHQDQDIYVREWDKNLKQRMKRHFGVKK